MGDKRVNTSPRKFALVITCNAALITLHAYKLHNNRSEWQVVCVQRSWSIFWKRGFSRVATGNFSSGLQLFSWCVKKLFYCKTFSSFGMNFMRIFCKSIHYPSLVTDRNQTSLVCSAWAESARYEFSEKSLQLKARYSRKRTMFYKESSLNYWQIVTNLAPLVAHAWGVEGVHFQTNPFNGSRGTDDKVPCSRSKVPLIIIRAKPYLHHL